MNAAQSLVKNLQVNGVKYIFGIPGEENLALLDAIRQSNIQFIPTRHETSAAFMAGTIGRLTGKPGVALSTLGPGATNMLTGLAYAQLGGMPMIAITAQKPLGKDHEGRFQLLDVLDMMEEVTKSSERISDPRETPFVIANAYKTSVNERPGVSHIELPEDVAEMEVRDNVEIKYKIIRRPTVDEKALEHFGHLYNNSKSPLLFIGGGANRDRISDELNKFVRRNKIYFFTSQMGKGVVDELSEYYLGCAYKPEAENIYKAINASDLIISVGHENYEKTPALLGLKNKKIVNINFHGSSISSVYSASLDLVGDIANTIINIGDHIDIVPKENAQFEELAKWNHGNIQNGEVGGNKELFSIVRKLRDIMSDDSILCLDNGEYKLEVARHYPAVKPNTVLIDNALATMGAGIPSAIAAKLIYPEKDVVVIVGDGGLMMSAGEIETALRLGVSFSIVVLNDNGFGMIRQKQRRHGYEEFGVNISNPDLSHFLQSYSKSHIKEVELDEIIGEKEKGILFTVIDIKY